MRIRRLAIQNFRGIKSLTWVLPREQKLVALIGPGDSCKTTILDAIHLVLGDRWNPTFADTDFYGGDVAKAISIVAVISGISDALQSDTAFGLWMSGVAADGSVTADPSDDVDPALTVRLQVDSTLEPVWSVIRMDGDSHGITGTQRRSFSTFKLDERDDAQLRWSRTSALGRMSLKDGSERTALAAAARAARVALAQHENTSLADVAAAVQAQANLVGGGSFSQIRPGLDTSRSALGASLALYEDVVPLSRYGTGSKRLVSLAVQQIAAGDRSVALVDEVESGLEPHRAVRLLTHLAASPDYEQVFVTTHSPVVVEQARLENLATVRSDDGDLRVRMLSDEVAKVQPLRRARPSSFLARRIVVVEGKTEQGVVMAFVAHWDTERSAAGKSTSAGEGLALQDAQGGTEVGPRARILRRLGYDVLGLMDNDDRSADKQVQKAEADGIEMVRWDAALALEDQLVAELSASELTSLIALAASIHGAANIERSITEADADWSVPSGLDVRTWIGDGISIDTARSLVAIAAKDRNFPWFKLVEPAESLGEWVLKTSQESDGLASFCRALDRVHSFIYDDTRDGTFTQAADEE